MKVCNIWLLEVLCILSTLKIVNTSVNTSREPNVKISTQSSNHSAPFRSGKAVDGCRKQIFDIDSCCSHTKTGEKEAWWQLNLEGLIVMEYVKVYYRNQGYAQRQRFGGYQVYQSNTSDWRNGYLCHKDITSTSAALSLTPQINCTGSAQYLTIYSDRRSGGLSWYSKNAILELCEVEVYGCPLGKYGDGNCESDCDVGCANSLCDPVTGGCAYCAVGYYRSGSLCVECPSNCYDNICYVESGVCSACKPGYYGDICNTSCPSNCKGDICNQTSGLCTECAVGFYGGFCSQLCPIKCKNILCNLDNGQCKECVAGLYGTECNQSCPVNCQDTLCHISSGECKVCEAGFYGSQCLKSCGSCQGVSCDKDTGDCATGCTDGWTGNECDNKVVLITNGDSTVGIGVGSGVVILVLVIVIIVLVRRRTMKRGDTTSSSHMTDISLSRTAKELKQNQDNTYDEIATCNNEQTIAQISHNEANYEQLGRREVEIPNIYATTDVDKET
ncbi:cell death abnormality protein 1-like [Mizuhopecten yessoensis]|uniref:cell death abnormality protein 1-like n=1 Tax=Mizuhopecten yessoensis TaxID=6573 RepID=UPI000B45E483|nr:cell death abnormality protein 1-like [Mizuhopecten yessoensis]